MKSLEDWLTDSAKFAAHCFKEEGRVIAMWLGETKSGEIVPIISKLNDKERTLAMVRRLFNEKKVARFVFMTEAWVIAAKKDRESEAMEYVKSGKSLADHPDRREIIVVTAEDKTRALMGQMFILRPE